MDAGGDHAAASVAAYFSVRVRGRKCVGSGDDEGPLFKVGECRIHRGRMVADDHSGIVRPHSDVGRTLPRHVWPFMGVPRRGTEERR